MNSTGPKDKRWRRLVAALGWTRSSYFVISAFLATLALIVVVWWPLVEDVLATFSPKVPWWAQFDWLLLGNFLVMSFLIMAGANLRADVSIVFVGLMGGLVIESWGTQTELWTYYTLERPPLWIIPAWPIASLSIDRLVRILDLLFDEGQSRFFRWSYWLIFPAFYGLMVWFVWPTMDKSLTIMALLLCAVLMATPTDHRRAVLTFAAGAGLGYFLELWGTTRACWTYYTLQTPPFFAVLAHGMAAVSFWRAELVLKRVVFGVFKERLGSVPQREFE